MKKTIPDTKYYHLSRNDDGQKVVSVLFIDDFFTVESRDVFTLTTCEICFCSTDWGCRRCLRVQAILCVSFSAASTDVLLTFCGRSCSQMYSDPTRLARKMSPVGQARFNRKFKKRIHGYELYYSGTLRTAMNKAINRTFPPDHKVHLCSRLHQNSKINSNEFVLLPTQ